MRLVVETAFAGQPRKGHARNRLQHIQSILETDYAQEIFGTDPYMPGKHTLKLLGTKKDGRSQIGNTDFPFTSVDGMYGGEHPLQVMFFRRVQAG